ncbi:CRISPR-associated helicase Cas3' [Bifidobacterium sp. MA2]|uniref:CRISPR-associated helicase Cas3 n=1 Tax=Bifidobacterium santillanense TaxID=2809028 RepID=A0ABS5UNC5_9BIFI|nr:CRISPR-associated helicase Cas3' [Bifidobacterium santillanense]MBT1172415.1 CRISPR-associated helicase Cas3' [Bifidobacterium santillanense]
MTRCAWNRRISPRAASIWAKTAYRGPENDDRYLQLWQHLADAGETASHVWEEFVADDVKGMLARDIGGEETAGTLYRFIAAIHDVGKASPAFVAQNDGLADRVRDSGLSIDPIVAKDRERSSYRHELVGYAAVRDWFLAQGFPVEPGTFAYGVACIVAGHHGTSLTGDKRRLVTPGSPESYRMGTFVGGEAWAETRNELLDWAADMTGALPVLRSLSRHPLRRRSQIILTSLVVVADWSASDSRLFPLNEGSADEESFDPSERAARAWRMLGLPGPWRVRGTDMSPDDMFARRFAIPGARLRPMQREASRLARAMESPGLMIIEANMGEGKTEAALIAAEILAERFHCGGIYYALPSQATVNAMFSRVLDWVGRLPAGDHGNVGSVFLAHGRNELNGDYERLREQWFDGGGCMDADSAFAYPSDGIVDEDSDDDSEHDWRDPYGDHMVMQAVVNSWLTGRRRGNLSDFVVGTIDQVLMAGLKSKYVVLRHLALAGKVVILDEVHSNTAYMNVYMETVLSWLGAYGVPVIMLSATLPQERRRAFLTAYRDGARAADAVERESVDGVETTAENGGSGGERLPRRIHRRVIPVRKRSDGRVDHMPESGSEGDGDGADGRAGFDMRYPLISLATAERVHGPSAPAPSGRAIDVEVSMMDDDDSSLVSLLRDGLRDGGCAVVIRDTVARAQKTYQTLRDALGDGMDVTLAHSRFLACDRARIDRELLARYGRHGDPKRRSGIVVATQVVEQSLDVDFDLMVTDIAPIDLVLQRIGRLHRHHRGDGENRRPEPLRHARLVITGIVSWKYDGPPEFTRGLERVYPRYLLLRSLAILGIEPGKCRSLNVPGDIPHLVQTVYSDAPVCPDSWRDGNRGELEARRRLEQDLDASRSLAGQFRIFRPQYDDQPFDLTDWLKDNVTDPDTPGKAAERKVRAGVREGDDSFEVVVLQQGDDGALRLPPWSGFDGMGPLPDGFGTPAKEQVRAMLSCTISLGRTALGYLDLDSVIGAFECATPERWYDYMQLDRSLAGQLMITLDESGTASYQVPLWDGNGGIMEYRTLRIQYSPQRGWQAYVDK